MNDPIAVDPSAPMEEPLDPNSVMLENMHKLSLPKSVQSISIHLDASTCDSFLSKLNSNELQALDISVHREYLSTKQISDWRDQS